jgi:AhpD family alkylhydroperoxidase
MHITHPLTTLQPIERPQSLLVRLACWWSKRSYGKAISPLTTVYARFPALLRAQIKLFALANGGLDLPLSLHHLLSLYTSEANGCAFCSDLHLTDALRAGLTRKHITALSTFSDHKLFSDAERAALSAAQTLTARAPLSDDHWTALRAHFDERQITQILWLICFTSYLNSLSFAFNLSSDHLCPLPATHP